MKLQVICEYIDAGASLRVVIWLRGKDLPPESRFVLRLRSRTGRKVFAAHAVVRERVNSVGHRTRSQLDFSFPVADLPNGAFRMEVSAVGNGQFRNVEPSAGLLASSRPLALEERRVQAFPAAGRPGTWVRITRWTTAARYAWRVRHLLRDLAFVAHRRRFTWVRVARLLTTPLVPRGAIWLIGERPDTARDNGRAFFTYLRDSRPAAPIYFVLSSESAAWREMVEIGNVVPHSSWQHRILMLHAEVLANAYSIKHMLPTRWHPGAYMKQCAWRLGAYRVYLKHGVHLSPDALKRANGGYDLIATVGPGEHNALEATSGYADQLVCTGLARYDTLVPTPPSRKILFMPTWRRYLVPTLFSSRDDIRTTYEGSTYQQFIDGICTNPQLVELLEQYNLTLEMIPHYNLGQFITSGEFHHGRVRIHDAATADIPGLLRECDLLLTDYSSVHFDVAYLGTPVVYAQFDEEDFSRGHSALSWFDFTRDGFGPVTHDLASTLTVMRRYVEESYEREPVYGERVGKVFSHRDRRNRERLLTAIDTLTSRSDGPEKAGI